MIQDRLTALFRSEKPAHRAAKKAKVQAEASKPAKPAAIEVYGRGRRLPSSVWM